MPAPIRDLPELPSVFHPVPLREWEDAVTRATALAPQRGAGTLVWVGSAARAEAAVVLEPEVPLGQARLALLAAANALADAVGVLGPPEAAVALRWPATLIVNGGDCGRLRLVAAPNAAEDAVPDWLVVGFVVTLAAASGQEPGRDPERTCLEEEGFAGVTAAALTAAWARHLMAGLDAWQAAGPRRLSEEFLARLLDHRDTPQLRRGIDPASGALVLEAGGTRRLVALA